MSNQTLAFIGAGNMATALISGMLNQGISTDRIWAADRSSEQLQKLQEQYGIHTSTDNQVAAAEADVIILAVKPQVLKTVLSDLAPLLKAHQPLLISIAAGITCASLDDWAGGEQAIVRCMPNTPALVQTGATGLYATASVSAEQRLLAEQIMMAVGIVQWVQQEPQLDIVTAVSGSGPAYFFLLMESIIEAGEALGLSRNCAEQLTLQTALGAAKMAQESDVDVAELRRRVTSPRGTTEQSLLKFEQGDFKALVHKALSANIKRSTELATELGN